MRSKKDLQSAIQVAREKVSLRPVYLDTETTGLDQVSEIVEICVVDDGGQVLFESLVKPTRSIPRDVIRIHGINDEIVAAAPKWIEVWPQVEAVLAGRQVGIYNAEFDLRMMRQSHAKYWLPWKDSDIPQPFCIMKLFAQFHGEWNAQHGSYRWHSLERAGQLCRIPLPNAHRAKDDTLLARAVLHYMATRQV